MIQERTEKLDFIKTRIFCFVKTTVKIIKRQMTDWGKKYLQKVCLTKDYYLKYTEELKINNKKTKPI